MSNSCTNYLIPLIELAFKRSKESKRTTNVKHKSVNNGFFFFFEKESVNNVDKEESERIKMPLVKQVVCQLCKD